MNLAIRHSHGSVRPQGPPARHAVTVIGYQVTGEIEMEHSGVHTISAGDLYVIPAGHHHRALAARDAELWTIAIEPHRFAEPRFAEVRRPIDAIDRGGLPRVTVPEDRRAFVISLFAEMARERAGSALRQESLLALLLEEMAAAAPHALYIQSQPVDLAARAVSFIATHALGPLSLADVAAALGKNRTHLADVVRAATGQTVGELIADVRLDEARRRLEDTDELVEVIGERVGYADPTHFARTFRRRYGRSPRAWRARLIRT